MRKGSFVAFALVGLTAVTAMTACQPLYGGKPEKMVNPTKKRHLPEAPEAKVDIKPIESCLANFHEDAKSWKSDKRFSTAAVSEADTAMQQANRATEASEQINLTKQAIDRYRAGLQKDPYNAALTVKLAIAYDAMYRKGCALALLKRVGAMALNPRYQQAASSSADDVANGTTSFRQYRTEAVSAVGR